MNDIRQEIESYVRGEMSSEERRMFENRMAQDPELRKEVEEITIIAKGIRYMARNDLRRMAEKARDTYHGKAKAKKPQRPWLIIAIVLVSAGLLWLGYLFFGQAGDNTPTEDSQEEMNFGVASESTSPTEHDLSMSGKAAMYSENVAVLNTEGNNTGDSIHVSTYRDETLTHTHYLLQEPKLNFYLPAGVDFALPPVLFKRSDSLFIRTATETLPLIKGGTLQILGSQ